MPSKLEKFTTLPWSEKRFLFSAWFKLGLMRAAILTRPFKQLTRPLQHHKLPPTAQPISAQQLAHARRIGYLVAAAARYTPWQSLCLVQVLVVQRELVKRHIPGQFYLGVVKGADVVEEGAESAEDAATDLAAHAWLQCGEEIVNGGAGHERFTIVSTFSWA